MDSSKSCETSSTTAIDTPKKDKPRKKIISVAAAPINLTPKQCAFCHEWVKDFNGKQAAIRTGYSEKTAEGQASRLLSNAKVSAYCKQLVDAKIAALDMTADDVLRGLADIALHGTPDAARVRAYELLGKYFSLWGDQFGVNVENKGGQVVFYMPEKGR